MVLELRHGRRELLLAQQGVTGKPEGLDFDTHAFTRFDFRRRLDRLRPHGWGQFDLGLFFDLLPQCTRIRRHDKLRMAVGQHHGQRQKRQSFEGLATHHRGIEGCK